MGTLFVRTGFVASEPLLMTQSRWDEASTVSNAEIPFDDWTEYTSKDNGVVTGDDLRLEKANYTATQTSADGTHDTCNTAGCSAGDGFGALDADTVGTKVISALEESSIQLISTGSGEEFTLSLTGSYETNDTTGLYIDGNTAYLASDTAGLHIVDISNTAEPDLVSTLNTSGKARNVLVIGTTAYVAGDTAGLQIIDVSIPGSPALIGTYNTSGRAADVAVSGAYAFVADENKGVQVINISSPSAPSLNATHATAGDALGMVISGNTAYVAEDGNGLDIVNITTPNSPVSLATYTTAGTPNGGIFVSGTTLYVTLGVDGFEIVDVTNSSNPVSIGTFDTSGAAMDITVIGATAYVAMDTGVAAVDVSTPSSPTLLGTYETADTASGIMAAGATAYVAAGDSGILLIQSGESSTYFASGTFESSVVDLGSDVYDISAVMSDINIPDGIFPVGLEIPADDPGLVGLWHLDSADGSDNAAADALGSHDGVLHATPGGTNSKKTDMWDAGGQIGQAAYKAIEFDGSDDYIRIGNMGASIKSVSFWINHASPTSGDVIMQLNGSQSINIGITTGEITTLGIPSPTIYVDGSSASTVLSSGWHHVAVVTSTAISAADVELGRVSTSYFDGMLDEVAFYSTELSSNRIKKLHQGLGVAFQIAASDCENGASTAPACRSNTGWGDADTPYIGPDGTGNTYLSGPVAFYHFDEASGSNLIDSSGYGHDGVLTIGVAGDQSSSAAAWLNGADSIKDNPGGQSLSFDGNDDYVSVGDLEADVRTVEFWINHSSNEFGGVIMSLSDSRSIVISTSGDIVAAGFGAATVYVDGNSGSAQLAKGWHHVAVVSGSAFAADAVLIGKVDSQFMSGLLDEVIFYDRALDTNEIKARYNHGDGVRGAVFGTLNSSSLNNKRYLKFKAFMSSRSMFYNPEIRDVSIGYTAVPTGATLESSVFDTGDTSNFIEDISWSEQLNGHDVRVQLATSGDMIEWNHCGDLNCSSEDWLDFDGPNGNYYTKSAGNTINIQSRNADNDRYFKYKVWMKSADGVGTPAVDDVKVTFDSAHLALYGPDGQNNEYTAQAQKPFNIILRALDSDGNVIDSHDGSRAVRLTASAAQPDKGTCESSFTAGGTSMTRNVVFFNGEATVANVVLCDESVKSFTVSAVETIGGKLESEEDLVIMDVTGGEERTDVTLYWNPLDDCANFHHYEAWYAVTSNVQQGIGTEWDHTDDINMAFCSTDNTTITGLLADTKYYFKLYAVDNDGNAVEIGTSDQPIEEEEETDLSEFEEDVLDENNLPDGVAAYELLIKVGDNVHPDPQEDARASYKHGDVVVILPAGHSWSKTERESFLIMEMYLTEDEKAELLSPQTANDGKMLKRRAKNINLRKMGFTKSDKGNMSKRKDFNKALKGKKIGKAKVIKNR